MVDGEELFYARENAGVVKDAEEYYRFARHQMKPSELASAMQHRILNSADSPTSHYVL